MIYSILLIQFTCLTVVFHNPGPLWSATLYFILHAFLHLIIVIFFATCDHTIASCFAAVVTKQMHIKHTIKQLKFNITHYH